MQKGQAHMKNVFLNAEFSDHHVNAWLCTVSEALRMTCLYQSFDSQSPKAEAGILKGEN